MMQIMTKEEFDKKLGEGFGMKDQQPRKSGIIERFFDYSIWLCVKKYRFAVLLERLALWIKGL